MTKEEFKKVLDVQGGQFDFQIGRYEGMIGISPSQVVIWVDDSDFCKGEPEFIGYYRSVDELLEKFQVKGQLFAETLLPKIGKLHRIVVA